MSYLILECGAGHRFGWTGEPGRACECLSEGGLEKRDLVGWVVRASLRNIGLCSDGPSLGQSKAVPSTALQRTNQKGERA